MTIECRTTHAAEVADARQRHRNQPIQKLVHPLAAKRFAEDPKHWADALSAGGSGEDARRFLRSTVPATIRIEVNAAPDCEMVLADASQLHQVLLNLGTNAAHAMHHTGGVMRITLYPAAIAETTTYNQLAPGKYQVELSASQSTRKVPIDLKPGGFAVVSLTVLR